MTRRASRLAKALIGISVLAALVLPLNGAWLLFELAVWVLIVAVLHEGRRRSVARYGTGPKARAARRSEWR